MPAACDRPRQRLRAAGALLFAAVPAFLLAGCTSSGDGEREAQPPASTTTTMPAAETTRFDIATQPGGAVADGEGVWVIEGSGAVRITNDGSRAQQAAPVVADGRPIGAAGPMAVSDDGALFVASSTALDAEGSWLAVFGWVTRLDPGQEPSEPPASSVMAARARRRRCPPVSPGCGPSRHEPGPVRP